MSQALFTVSIYDTLGPDTTEYIINHAQLTCVVTSLPHIPTLLKLGPRIPSLKLIICLDVIDHGAKPGYSTQTILNALAAENGIAIHYIEDVEKLGAASAVPVKIPVPEDIITINYTSGTTGAPKGVVLTHSAAVAASSCARVVSGGLPNDTVISYLPLAHIFERITEQAALFCGSRIGYFHGDVQGLVEDMKMLRPSGFISVPRLFNKFGTEIRKATTEAPGFKGTLGRQVINGKLDSMNGPPATATNKNWFYDSWYTPKIASAMGLQNTRRIVSGSAPLDGGLHQFLRAAFGTEFMQGYGLTESYAIATVQHPKDFSTGNIGGVLPTAEMCLQSVPDMEYLVTDKPNPRGEVLMRGPHMFKEYYKNPTETDKAIIDGGWFRTGDVGEVDELGRFKIIDRVKNVLKLSQGEYISPERIENVYLANFGILTQAYVHGDSAKSCLVSIFGIDPVTFAPFASNILKRTINAADLDAVREAAADQRVKNAVLVELDKVGKKHKFNSWERVKNVMLEVEPFTIENELLTPT